MNQKKFLGTAIAVAAASVLIANGAFADTQKAADKPKADKKFKCVGGNSCKGKSECGVPGAHSCHTQNSCKGKGWIMTVDEKECTALKAKNEKPAEGKKSR